ncbi:hypothetical protein HF918_02020 [Acidithiobacillus ferriphilus]|nr:hypothetical protein [Acidithiobacillus ferriphilus]
MLAIVLAAMILFAYHLNENTLKTVVPVLAVLISGLIGYGAFLDEKRFEKLYDSKLELYRKMLNEILYIYRVPILFLRSDANSLPVEELKSAVKDVNSSLSMLLLSNAAAYSVLSSLEKKVREKLYALILLFIEVNKVGARDHRKVMGSAFYGSLDKSKFSLGSIRDHVSVDPVDSLTSAFSAKLQMYLQVAIAMSEFNDLVVDLINEMRKDLEIGYFTELEIDEIKKEFRGAISETFDVMGKILKQLAKNTGIDLDI